MVDELEATESGLTYTDNISIAWQAVDYQPDEAHLAMVNESNEAFLRAVSAIGEFSRDLSEEPAGITQEILRLDLKLNLLLDLVSQLLYKQLDIPAITHVSVTSTDIVWESNNIPEYGQVVFMQVYIQRGTPKPLCFYGQVVSSQSDIDAGSARVHFLGLSGSAQAWLDKLIFRHHRREIAFKKTQQSS